MGARTPLHPTARVLVLVCITHLHTRPSAARRSLCARRSAALWSGCCPSWERRGDPRRRVGGPWSGKSLRGSAGRSDGFAGNRPPLASSCRLSGRSEPGLRGSRPTEGPYGFFKAAVARRRSNSNVGSGPFSSLGAPKQNKHSAATTTQAGACSLTGQSQASFRGNCKSAAEDLPWTLNC